MAKETEPPSRETLDLLRPRLRAHYLHTPAPEAMIQIAVDLLLEGIETPAVLRCACMSRVDDRDDIRDWFYEAMAELGVPKMTYQDAAFEEIRYLAPAIVEPNGKERQAAIERVAGLFGFDDFAYGHIGGSEARLWFACWLNDEARADQGLDIDECATEVLRIDPSG